VNFATPTPLRRDQRGDFRASRRYTQRAIAAVNPGSSGDDPEHSLMRRMLARPLYSLCVDAYGQ